MHEVLETGASEDLLLEPAQTRITPEESQACNRKQIQPVPALLQGVMLHGIIVITEVRRIAQLYG